MAGGERGNVRSKMNFKCRNERKTVTLVATLPVSPRPRQQEHTPQ